MPTSPPAAAPSSSVTLYCSVDEVYARPIVRYLEQRGGLRINVLYDTEAAKTAGLANKIRAEQARPRGDVFWASALLQTMLLGRQHLLQPYLSPSAAGIPDAFKDRGGLWCTLGVRPRVILYRPGQPTPHSWQDLAGRQGVGIGNPQFGTVSDWTAALAARWGPAATLSWFGKLHRNQIQIFSGNSLVAQALTAGNTNYGVVDTDDFLQEAARQPDLKATTLSAPEAVLIPGSVAMLRGAPHPAAARKLLDLLLSPTCEALLVQSMPGVLPLRPAPVPSRVQKLCGSLLPIRSQNNVNQWPAMWDKVQEPLFNLLALD